MFNGNREKRQAEAILDRLPSDDVELTLTEQYYVGMAKRGAAQILRYAGVMVGRYPDHEAWCFAQDVAMEGFQRAVWNHMEACTDEFESEVARVNWVDSGKFTRAMDSAESEFYRRRREAKNQFLEESDELPLAEYGKLRDAFLEEWDARKVEFMESARREYLLGISKRFVRNCGDSVEACESDELRVDLSELLSVSKEFGLSSSAVRAGIDSLNAEWIARRREDSDEVCDIDAG